MYADQITLFGRPYSLVIVLIKGEIFSLDVESFHV